MTLIDQQMWCWGCDVRRKEGNLLLAYGAQKRPSPNPRFHSAYTFQMPTQVVLNLWGWGIWASHIQQGSLFIARSRFQLRYSPTATLIPEAWRVNDLPPTTGIHADEESVHAISLLESALEWIGEYERWVCREAGTDYRKQNTTQWPQTRRHRGGISPAEMAERWFELSMLILEHQTR